MQHVRRYRKAAVLCAGLQLVLSFALTANLVLCQTSAGHVEIESAFSSECCTGHALPAGVRGAEAEDACGCIDTPLVRTPIDGRPKLVLSGPVPSPSLLAVLPAVDQLPARCAGDPPDIARARTVLAARRSVVLVV